MQAHERVDQILSEPTVPIHIIGAGGVGMSGLALLLAHLGFAITASDQKDGLYLQKLKSKLKDVWVGSQPQRILPGSVVFYSSAVPENDKERVFALQNRLHVFSRHPLLYAITRRYFTIGVAGAHGKTTTSAWVADFLIRAGLDPCALIGGTVREWQSQFRMGQGQLDGKPLLVMEADESDSSFLSLDLNIALITNIDLDHVDRFSSLQDIQNEYIQFAQSTLGRKGVVLPSIECAEFLKSYTTAYTKEGHNAWITESSQFMISLPGLFNRRNFSMLYLLARELQIDLRFLRETAEEFKGVKRRMEIRGNTGGAFGLDVIDDYGHHPHEIQSVLESLATTYSQIIIVWEGHRLSRFLHFRKEFEQVLKKFQARQSLFALPFFHASESLESFPEFSRIYEEFLQNLSMQQLDDNFSQLIPVVENSQTSGCIVFFGAGNSSEAAGKFLEIIERGK